MNINLTSSVRQARRVGLTRRLAALIAVGAALAFPVMANAAPVSVNLGGSGPYKVMSTCTVGAGVTTDGKWIKLSFTATADATATNGSYAVVTSVTCHITDQHGVPIGNFTNTLFGPHAVAVAIISVALGDVPQVQPCGSAAYSDTGSFSTC
ncbi:MAG: hypothetical protein ACYDGR_07690 [Candidatus Dormibacteria bacterium]